MTEEQKPAEFITIGEVQGHFGEEGELKVKSLTDFPERFEPGARVFIAGQPYTISGVKQQKGGFILRFEGVETTPAATPLLRHTVDIPSGEKHPLPAGRYYQFDIIGLEVVTTAGVSLGRVTDVLETGANDVYVVKRDGGEVLIPAIADVVKKVDLKGKRLVIEPIEGMLG